MSDRLTKARLLISRISLKAMSLGLLAALVPGAELAAQTPAAAPKSPTIASIRQQGQLVCGVAKGIPGFSYPDKDGRYHGLDVDVCRAVAAAVLGDAEKVKFVPLTARSRFAALQSGEIDLMLHSTTGNLVRSAQMGLAFPAVNFYGGQTFLVKANSGIKTVKDLNGATLCTTQGSTTEVKTPDYARANNMTIHMLTFENQDEALKAYIAGRCDTYSQDTGSIAAVRSMMKNPAEHSILPDIITKAPMGPFVRQGDEAFTNVVRWSHFAMVAAEEYGVTSKNVDEMKAKSTDPEIRRILGVEGDSGKMLGLENDWAYNIIKQVGNYGEAYDRSFGAGSPLKLPRGLNALWKDGGLQYAQPFQ